MITIPQDKLITLIEQQNRLLSHIGIAINHIFWLILTSMIAQFINWLLNWLL